MPDSWVSGTGCAGGRRKGDRSDLTLWYQVVRIKVRRQTDQLGVSSLNCSKYEKRFDLNGISFFLNFDPYFQHA